MVIKPLTLPELKQNAKIQNISLSQISQFNKKISYFTVVSVEVLPIEFLGKFHSLSQPISIHSDMERPRHFDHFGTHVLNLAMYSDDNPIPFEGVDIARYIETWKWKFQALVSRAYANSVDSFLLCFYNHLR